MNTNYRIAYDKYWQDLKRKVPEEIATQLAVSYNYDVAINPNQNLDHGRTF